MYCEYDGQTYYPKYSEDLVHCEVLLPENAPEEYKDPYVLWNSVELVEKSKDAQLARTFRIELPNEWSYDLAKEVVKDYCERNFVSKGMCVQYAIHDSENDKGQRNLHCHIMLTLRGIDEKGKWMPKQKKVYKRDENGERIPDIDEKTGQQKVDKTAKSILVSCGARLAPFDIKELREITAYDELELDTLGDKKTALFLIMSDTDATFNFLISMIYTQLFNLLCEKADDVYGGRLPVHVTCLIDEMANIGQIPNLEKLMATIRSREISACLVLQAKSQLKAIYKDNADTIIGNCDSQIFLGGSEQTTLKDLNTTLGKETIDMYNTGETRGQSQSYNMNYQKLGHDLMSIDELAVMDGSKCIVQVRGVRPFFSDKYDLTKHPKYHLTADADKRNWFDIEKFLKKKDNLILKADDQFTVIEVTE